MKVEVRDQICGDGKTTDVLNEIKDKFKNGCEDKYVIITPYLSECHDIAGTKPIEDDEYQRPVRDDDGSVKYYPDERNLSELRFKHPSFNNKEGSKAASLRFLMSNRNNIVSTHSLFTNIKLDTLLNAEDYTLIVDEALDIFSVCDLLPRKETNKLLKKDVLTLRDDGQTLKFDRKFFGNPEKYTDEDAVKDTRYEELAVLCDNHQLLLVNGNVLLWELSAELLKKFKKVIILTYLFEGREMSVYLKKHNIPYEVKKGSKGGKDIAGLIELIEDDKLNLVGEDYYALSSTKTKKPIVSDTPPVKEDFDDYQEYLREMAKFESQSIINKRKLLSATEANDVLRKNLKNVMENVWGAKSADRYFTCLSANKVKIANTRYNKNWIAFSTKAVNNLAHTHHVAFLMNVFMMPYIKEVCNNGDFTVDEDLVSLSHLVQFIFRSAIRNSEPIKVYVPSSRMRGLLKDYLNGKYD